MAVDAHPGDAAEATVNVDLTVVFRRPALNSGLVGVLVKQDVVISEAAQDSQRFLRVFAGSWVRDKRNRVTFFQLEEDCWILRVLPSKPRVHVVMPLSMPTHVLCYEVVNEPVVELACPVAGGAEVHVWPQGSVLEAAEELPGGWLRLTSPDDKRRTRSTFVYSGPPEEFQRGHLVFRSSKAVAAALNSEADVHKADVAAEQSSPTRATRPVVPGREAVAVALAFSENAASAPDVSSPHASTTLEPAVKKRPVAYFGIVDLKYDSRKDTGNTLKVLELGSGLSSRFSGDGEAVLQNYQQNFTLVRQLDRGALVDNKKMTHDIFVECGYSHLRPKQVCFPRVYANDLAPRIIKDLGIIYQEDTVVVLKLVNRCRGAGVVVVRAGRELDDTLRILLCHPEDFTKQHGCTLDAALSSDSSSFREQCLHWWSNECPFFVAECCEASHSVQHKSSDFDGTMRIGFVLLRSEKTESTQAVPLGIEFLGGYWKLPSAPTTSTDVRARCLSKARTGTCPVAAADLKEVEDQLRHALPAIFAIERAGVGALVKRYTKMPLIFSFVLARHAASQVKNDSQGKTQAAQQALKILAMAADRVDEVPKGIPFSSAASHLERQKGAVAAASGDWAEAVKRWRCSLDLYPWNATSEHLIGYYHLRQQELAQAELCFLRSLCLDPEFKASYANLSATYLAMSRYADAKQVAEEGLKRHPFAFQCSYNVGIASVAMLKMHLYSASSAKCIEEMANESCKGLSAACYQKESTKSDWSSSDDELLKLVTQLADNFRNEPDWDAALVIAEKLTVYPGWQIRNLRP